MALSVASVTIIVVLVSAAWRPVAAKTAEEWRIIDQKALEEEETAANWHNCGVDGGVTLRGQHYTGQECNIQALTLDPHFALAWYGLGTVRGGAVAGKDYTAKECYEKSLTLDPHYADAWWNFANQGGGKIKDKHYSAGECRAKAAALYEEKFRATAKKMSTKKDKDDVDRVIDYMSENDDVKRFAKITYRKCSHNDGSTCDSRVKANTMDYATQAAMHTGVPPNSARFAFDTMFADLTCPRKNQGPWSDEVFLAAVCSAHRALRIQWRRLGMSGETTYEYERILIGNVCDSKRSKLYEQRATPVAKRAAFDGAAPPALLGSMAVLFLMGLALIGGRFRQPQPSSSKAINLIRTDEGATLE